MGMIKRKLPKILLILITVLWALYLVTSKFIEGGRWGIGFPIAMADRFLSGECLYSNLSDGMKATTSYFPLMTFLGIPLRFLFHVHSELAAIIFAGIMLIIVMLLYSKIAVGRERRITDVYAIILMLVMFQFKELKYYFLEWHPDIYVTLFAAIATIMILNYIDTSEYKYLICFVFTMYLVGICKQNGIMYYVGFGMFLLFNRKISIRKKVFSIIGEVISGICTIATIRLIEGCWEATVLVNSLHDKMSFNEYIYYIAATIYHSWIVLLGVMLFILLLYKKKLKLSAAEEMWLCGSMCWLVFGIYGALKEGANSGNIEASVFPLLPFAANAIYYIINQLFAKKRKLINGFVLLLLAAVSVNYLYTIPNNINIGCKRVEEQKAACDWINSHYSGKTVAIWSPDYLVYSESDVEFSTDMYTVLVYFMAELVDDEELSLLSDRLGWDVVFMTNNEEIIDSYKETLDKYVLVENENVPNLLRGKVYERK